ncbi:MAG: hypothetical protein ACUVTO_00980 [Candidatus Caldatribacteriaceae bacterium]
MPNEVKKDKERVSSLQKRLKEDFALFFLFHEAFSEPVCRRVHPLFCFPLQRVLRKR